MSKRVVCLFALFVCGFFGLVMRYFSLTEDVATDVLVGQSTATVTVGTARGTIYDRAMHPLVNQTYETRLSIAPLSRTLGRLSKMLPEEVFSHLSQRLQGGRPIVTVVGDTFPEVTGVLRFRVPVRNGTVQFAPHLIGYLSGDGCGAVGLEQAYDAFLSACCGRVSVTYEVNAAGHVLASSTPTVTNTLADAKAGLVLTLDKEMQIFAEQVAAQRLKKGALLILKADTSEVLATVSVPSFQPNTVSELLEAEDAPLLDRTLSNYNCGSVFKIVSAAAALETGVPVSRTYTCTGATTVNGIVFHCHNRLGHGTLNMTEAFASSCNCYFIQLIEEAGAEALYPMATALGFDRSVLLAEGYKTARATLPSYEELQGSAATLANLSFGQGALLATPYHLAQVVGAVLKDGDMLRPSVVAGKVDRAGTFLPSETTPPQTVFSPTTAALLRKMMEAATAPGTTGEAADPANGMAAGKSGTAESGWITENGESVQNWFVGYYPAETPAYIVVVLAEDSNTTGVSAASVFSCVCDGLYSFMPEN